MFNPAGVWALTGDCAALTAKLTFAVNRTNCQNRVFIIKAHQLSLCLAPHRVRARGSPAEKCQSRRLAEAVANLSHKACGSTSPGFDQRAAVGESLSHPFSRRGTGEALPERPSGGVLS